MAHYVTFLLDLAAEGPNRAIAKTVRYEPDPATQPPTGFVWKVTCDGEGTVAIRGLVKGGSTLIGTAVWEGGAIKRPRQGKDNGPTGPQWDFVATALAAELATRRASGAPEDPTLVEPVSDVEGNQFGDRGRDWVTRPDDYFTNPRVTPPTKKRISGPMIGVILLAGTATVALVVWAVVALATEGKGPPRAKPPTPVAATASPPVAPRPATPPVAPRPATAPVVPGPSTPPAPPVTPEESIDVRVARAATFEEAIVLAKPAMTSSSDPLSAGATLLARYPRLRWAEVDVPAETTVGHVQKDSEAERGKRMCAEGVIEKIERRDLDKRKLFVGRLRAGDGDVIAFVALGTTGDLIKRSRAKFCGAVIGAAGDVVLLVGMFDLPENRGPIVEQ